jgi:hypothetical protein
MISQSIVFLFAQKQADCINYAIIWTLYEV